MKNIYKNSPKNLSKAKRILKKNNVIAVPTETVYGLAGNSYSDSAVKKIYKLKKRPKKNPLIIHYYSIKNLEKDAYLNDEFLNISVTLDKSNGLRKSGLSFPYFATHSSNGIFLKGGFEI